MAVPIFSIFTRPVARQAVHRMISAIHGAPYTNALSSKAAELMNKFHAKPMHTMEEMRKLASTHKEGARLNRDLDIMYQELSKSASDSIMAPVAETLKGPGTRVSGTSQFGSIYVK